MKPFPTLALSNEWFRTDLSTGGENNRAVWKNSIFNEHFLHFISHPLAKARNRASREGRKD